jgi:hypothetical protein
MRLSWLKWIAIVAALFVASGNAHAFADHAMPKTEQCLVHQHHDGQHRHFHGTVSLEECCCSCASCPAGLMTPLDGLVPHPAPYAADLAPAPASPLANRFLLPELDPPRPIALS